MSIDRVATCYQPQTVQFHNNTYPTMPLFVQCDETRMRLMTSYQVVVFESKDAAYYERVLSLLRCNGTFPEPVDDKFSTRYEHPFWSFFRSSKFIEVK